MSKAPLTPSPQQLIEKQQRNIENVMTAQNHFSLVRLHRHPNYYQQCAELNDFFQ